MVNVLVGGGQGLDMLLEFFGGLGGWKDSRSQHHECLYDLASDAVRTRNDGRFGHGFMLQQGTLNLERANSIAR